VISQKISTIKEMVTEEISPPSLQKSASSTVANTGGLQPLHTIDYQDRGQNLLGSASKLSISCARVITIFNQRCLA